MITNKAIYNLSKTSKLFFFLKIYKKNYFFLYLEIKRKIPASKV